MRPAYTQHMHMHPAHFGSLGGIICVTHQVHVYVCVTHLKCIQIRINYIVKLWQIFLLWSERRIWPN